MYCDGTASWNDTMTSMRLQHRGTCFVTYRYTTADCRQYCCRLQCALCSSCPTDRQTCYDHKKSVRSRLYCAYSSIWESSVTAQSYTVSQKKPPCLGLCVNRLHETMAYLTGGNLSCPLGARRRAHFWLLKHQNICISLLLRPWPPVAVRSLNSK